MKSKFKIKDLTLKISYTAFLSALCFVSTYFISIPYLGGLGYFNLSDAIILFSSITFGPFVGLFTGIIGASLGDLASGYVSCIPFTMVAKGLEALVAYFIYSKCKKELSKNTLYGFSTLLMVLTYFIYYLIVYNFDYKTCFISSGFDLIQGIAGYAISLVLLFVFQKTNLSYRLNK